MIPRSLRIPRELFNTKGSFLHGELFTLKISLNPESQKTLISTSVSKKVANSAVTRNKIRRRVYSVINEIINSLPKGKLLFFQAKKGVEKASFDQIKSEVIKLTDSM